MARSPARDRKKAESIPGQSGLRLRKPAEAVSALLRERARLLTRIANTEKKLVTEREQQREVAQAMFDRLHPLMSERAVLIDEIQSLFRALLAEGRLSKSARKKVAQFYRRLTESGEFEPLDARPSDEPDRDNYRPFEQAGFGPLPKPNARVESAKHAGGQPGNDTLRSLFRRLTIALHPDLTQQEQEQKRRTDVMKEVTRAYEEGNLARLLEIEQLWLSGGKVRSGQSDDATRCSELERIVSELKAQMQALEGALRDLRKASPLAQMFGLRRASAAAQLEQLEALVVAATEELEPIRRLRDFVQAFSGRKISLAEFLRGPQLLDQTERDLIEAALEFVLEGLDADFDLNEPRRRRPHGKRRSRRQQGFDDVPF